MSSSDGLTPRWREALERAIEGANRLASEGHFGILPEDAEEEDDFPFGQRRAARRTLVYRFRLFRECIRVRSRTG